MIIFQELQHQSRPCYYQVHFPVASIHQTLLPLHPSAPHKQNSSPDCLLFTHHSKQDRADTHKMGQPSIYERWVFIKKVQIKCIEKDAGERINYSRLPQRSIFEKIDPLGLRVAALDLSGLRALASPGRVFLQRHRQQRRRRRQRRSPSRTMMCCWSRCTKQSGSWV